MVDKPERSSPFLSILCAITLSACCDESSPGDCTQNELREMKDRRTAATVPQLVAVQDKVRLYRIWTEEPQAHNHWTYFTTPCGDVAGTITEPAGKTTSDFPYTVNGVGCK